MNLNCNLDIAADSFESLKHAIEEKLLECILDALPETEGGSVSVSGSADSSGNASVTVTGTVSWQ